MDALGQVERLALLLKGNPGFVVASLFFLMFTWLGLRHLRVLRAHADKVEELQKAHALKVEQLKDERLRSAMEQQAVTSGLLSLTEVLEPIALEAKLRLQKKRRPPSDRQRRTLPEGAGAQSQPAREAEPEPSPHPAGADREPGGARGGD